LIDLPIFQRHNSTRLLLIEHVTKLSTKRRVTLEMLEMIVALFALIVAFGALWFAGEANKRAEFQQQQFYDAHIRSLKGTVSELVRATRAVSKRINEIEGTVEGLIETNEDLNIGPKLAGLSGEVTLLREEMDSIGRSAIELRPARRRAV
jgi:hypothetical protein